LIGDKNWVIEMKNTKKSLWGEGSLMVGASSSAVSIAINPTGIFYFIAFVVLLLIVILIWRYWRKNTIK